MTSSRSPQVRSRLMTLSVFTPGAVAGVIAAAVALGVGQFVAGIVGPQYAPWATVGEGAIGLAPPAVKNFAIATFGSNDKSALVLGILVMLAIFAAVIGAAAMRRLVYGLAGLGLFTTIGMVAAVTQPVAGVAAAVPALIGGAAGALALFAIVRTASPAPAAVVAPKPAKPTAPARKAEEIPPGPDWTPGPSTQAPAPAPASTPVPASSPAPPPSPVPRPAVAAPRLTGYRSIPDRRRFLTTSATAAAIGGLGYLAGRNLSERASVTEAQATLRLPRPTYPAPRLPAGADLRLRGLSSFLTPNSSFYRVDTAIVLPEVAPSSWTLRVHGMVDRPLELSFDDILHRPLLEDYITLTCVSNPVAGPYIGNAKWLGCSLASVLRQAGIRSGAEQLLCTSVDGFTSGTPVAVVMDGRDALLAVGMNGTALPVEHGFPVRMVTPGLYGYVSATKWVTDIEVTTFGAAQAYWVQRGWSQQAPIKTESRIDIPNGGATLAAGRTAVAGVAWAQHKGVDAVEVRVNNGPWQRAALAAVPDIDTWRQWVWYWDATPGNYTLEARATDATGYTQTAIQEPPEPNGATGYPTIGVSVH